MKRNPLYSAVNENFCKKEVSFLFGSLLSAAWEKPVESELNLPIAGAKKRQNTKKQSRAT